MSEEKKSKKARRRERVEKEIEAIREVARTDGEGSRISKELTFGQASAVRFRSLQLIKESESHPVENLNEVQKQIDECWRLHTEGKV